MVIDGHNDLLLRLWRGEEPRHLDLGRAQEAGFAGGFFAVFVPGTVTEHEPPPIPYRMPLPEPLEPAAARATALELADVLFRLEAEGALRVARSRSNCSRERKTLRLSFNAAECSRSRTASLI